MQPWKTKVLCAGRYRPRQFEYHPLYEDTVVFGTLRGEGEDAANSSCYCCHLSRVRKVLSKRVRHVTIQMLRMMTWIRILIVRRAVSQSVSVRCPEVMLQPVIIYDRGRFLSLNTNCSLFSEHLPFRNLEALTCVLPLQARRSLLMWRTTALFRPFPLDFRRTSVTASWVCAG